MSKKYISTTLPYLNSTPHIGHTFEFVLADVIARYYRLKLGDENVFFNTGVDEHGLKIQQAAKLADEPIQDYCDFYARLWKNFCVLLQIDYNNFYRTSDKKHKQATSAIFHRIRASEKENTSIHAYTGKYCVGCESFITDKEVGKSNTCPTHKTELQEIDEYNTFFNLAKYRPYIEDILVNKKLSDELVNLVKEFDEISITRKNIEWGVKVDEDGTTLYVWFEALLNYCLACGYTVSEGEQSKSFTEFWENSTIICGKDNLKFQAYILQALNLALHIPQNKEVLVHGTILDSKGVKMSKSLGNVIDPIEQHEKYGTSPLRAYLCLGLNTFEDANYSELELVNLWNSFFVANYGNLISRTLHLVDIKGVKPDYNKLPIRTKTYLDGLTSNLNTLFETYHFLIIKEVLHEALSALNKRVNDEKPFLPDCPNPEEILNDIYQTLFVITKYIKLIIPEYSVRLNSAFINKKKVIIFEKLKYEETATA